jgi:pimeloyl-ACP methyl ester carboxylesterase
MKILGIILAVIFVVLALVWVKVRGPDIPYAELEARYANADSHFVDLPGGYRMHYRDEGVAGAPLLVLLHGYGDSFTSWEGWVRTLKSQFRLISVDFPGHGLTQAPADTTLSAESLADLLEALAAKLDLPKFAVAGNSMGGGVAWQFAVRHPQRLNALILVDAAGFPNEAPPGETPLAFRILKYPLGRALLRNVDNRPLIEAGVKFDVVDKSLITPAFVERWADFQRAPGHRAILMNVNLAGLGKGTDALAGLRVPTLVLWGQNDPLIEVKAASKFAAAIPGAKLITYPHVGHLPQIEIPERSAADTAAFLHAL